MKLLFSKSKIRYNKSDKKRQEVFSCIVKKQSKFYSSFLRLRYELILLFILGVNNMFASNEQIIVDTFYSATLNRSQWIYISLPESYFLNDTSTFPVMYFPEAYYMTGTNYNSYTTIKEWGKANEIKEVISVGIGNHNEKKLIPQNFSDLEYGTGIQNFYKFLSTELLPYIENKYPRIRKNERGIQGYSIYGWLAYYVFLQAQNDLNPHFKYVIAGDPALWNPLEHGTSIEAITNQAFLTNKTIKETHLYISTCGLAGNFDFVDPLVKQLNGYNIKGLDLFYWIMPETNHSEGGEPSFNEGLHWALKNRQYIFFDYYRLKFYEDSKPAKFFLDMVNIKGGNLYVNDEMFTNFEKNFDAGVYKYCYKVIDQGNDTTVRSYYLTVNPLKISISKNEVLITDTIGYPIGTLSLKGETLHPNVLFKLIDNNDLEYVRIQDSILILNFNQTYFETENMTIELLAIDKNNDTTLSNIKLVFKNVVLKLNNLNLQYIAKSSLIAKISSEPQIDLHYHLDNYMGDEGADNVYFDIIGDSLVVAKTPPVGQTRFKIAISGSQGCGGFAYKNFVLETTKTELSVDPEIEKAVFFPIPAANILNYKNLTCADLISLYDINGTPVKVFHVENTDGAINVSGLPSGNYFLVVKGRKNMVKTISIIH